MCTCSRICNGMYDGRYLIHITLSSRTEFPFSSRSAHGSRDPPWPITSFAMVYGTYNYSIHGAYKPTNITGGPHIVWSWWILIFDLGMGQNPGTFCSPQNSWDLWMFIPLNPMVLLIIIPMKNGYFIGKINPIFRQTHIATSRLWNKDTYSYVFFGCVFCWIEGKIMLDPSFGYGSTPCTTGFDPFPNS